MQIRLEPAGNPSFVTYERTTEGGTFDMTSLPQVTAPQPACAALICPVRRVGAAAGGVAGPGRQHNCTAQSCPVVQEEELAALEAECDMYRQTNGELTERSVVLCHR